MEKGLAAVSDGAVDILARDAPINTENLARVEFSQPFFHSGPQILTTDTQKTLGSRLLGDMKDLAKLEVFWILLTGVLYQKQLAFGLLSVTRASRLRG